MIVCIIYARNFQLCMQENLFINISIRCQPKTKIATKMIDDYRSKSFIEDCGSVDNVNISNQIAEHEAYNTGGITRRGT